MASLSDISKFRGILSKAKNIVVLTGAGISAESGIPTFRGAGGFWRTYQSQDLATAGAFKRSPSLVWEFYHHRREVVFTKSPNKAHFAIAQAEAELAKTGRKLTVITQNIDGLHQAAGSKNVVELHGSLFKTRCLKCREIAFNTDSPICEALLGKGAPDPEAKSCDIPEDQLPRCKKPTCGGLLRPHIVWFGENLQAKDIQAAENAMAECDACLVVGTSSVVYPAAMYAPMLAERNVPVAEFNIESTPATHLFMFHFPGPSSETVPEALNGICENELMDEALLSLAAPQAQPSSPANSQAKSPLQSNIPPERQPFTDCGGRSGNDNGGDDGNTAVNKPISNRQKLKLFMRDYGSTVIVFHITQSLALLGIIYLAFSAGVDMTWVVQKLGLEGDHVNAAAGASTFVIAYAVNKVLAPLRFAITFSCAPFIVRYLRRIGILKVK